MPSSAQPTITLEEYLATTYRPDKEYVNGVLVERNVGSSVHGRTMALMAAWFGSQEKAWRVVSLLSCRVQVRPTCVRVADVAVATPKVHPVALTVPPAVVVEILAKEDDLIETSRRAADYLDMGVGAVWIVNPIKHTGHWSSGGTWTQADYLVVPGTPIYVDLPLLFADF